MLKVLAACCNGMGSSLIIKMKIEKVLKDLNIEADVHHASVGEAKGSAKSYDLVLVSKTLIKEFTNVGNCKAVGIVNLISEAEIKEKVIEALGL